MEGLDGGFKLEVTVLCPVRTQLLSAAACLKAYPV